jgi:hypothetical protein
LASIQGDKGKPSAMGKGGSSLNMAVFIVNPNINQLINEHDSVTSVVKTQQKSSDNTGKYLQGLSVELGNIVAKNHGSDVDKGSHPRLLTFAYGS